MQEYFEAMAMASNDIQHTTDAPSFYCMNDPMDLVEFDEGVRAMAKNICLILELSQGTLGVYDATNDRVRIGLLVLCKSTDETFANIRAAYDQAKTTLNKLVAQIRLDCKGKYERPDNQDGPLRQQFVTFDTKIKYNNVSDVDGNWYGKSYYFDFCVPENLVWNPDDWTS